MSCPITAGCRSRSRTSPSSRPTSISTTIWTKKTASDGAVAGLLGRAGGSCARDKDATERKIQCGINVIRRIGGASKAWGTWNLGRRTTGRNRDGSVRQCNCKLFATRLAWLQQKPCGAADAGSSVRECAPSEPAVPGGWRSARQRPSLAEVFGTIATKPTGSFWRKLIVVPRARLSGRGRLHGPRQLGDLARRRLEVRLRAADRRAAFQSDGDPAAGAVRAARHRRRPRSGAGLPRRVSARGVVAALGAGRNRDLRHRPCRGDRHGDRAQSAVRHSARNRRADHRARRVPDSVDAKPRLPLDRGFHRHAARRHRGLLHRPDRDGRSRMGRGDPRLRADDRDRAQSRHALSRASASSAPP